MSDRETATAYTAAGGEGIRSGITEGPDMPWWVDWAGATIAVIVGVWLAVLYIASRM